MNYVRCFWNRSLTGRAAPGFARAAFLLAVFLAAALPLVSCSSAPRRPAEIHTRRNGAEQQLDLANRQAEQGDFEGALALLEFSRILAVTSDDVSLRVRTALARGNIFFYQGRTDEALGEWTAALAEAEASGDGELAAAARIHNARGRLLTAAPEEREAAAAAARDKVNAEIPLIKKDKLSIALGWTVIGLAEKETRRFNQAEAALRKALDIHEKGNYLEQAAYDWYVIASVRSVAGNYEEAEQALEAALALDRRAENSWGLALDWRALGDVYRKAGKTAQAEAAAARSAEILQALGRSP
ncbi:MAG: tetratricopeptide repeat protein [Treponema sp.]|jgi:tetratricopeptide (TPR) repeat protein|nr:tetratricopeptide repeat protein [Treponema sp.]